MFAIVVDSLDFFYDVEIYCSRMRGKIFSDECEFWAEMGRRTVSILAIGKERKYERIFSSSSS